MCVCLFSYMYVCLRAYDDGTDSVDDMVVVESSFVFS